MAEPVLGATDNIQKRRVHELYTAQDISVYDADRCIASEGPEEGLAFGQ